MAVDKDFSLLNQAARLAVLGHGTAEPNPMVGCIITNKDGDIVGEGFHEKCGEAHAEINALAMAGESAKGGTAFVTLEPCNHHGKTPPCSKALLNAGIVRVVIGATDPHTLASGGATFLEANGIEVIFVNDDRCNEILAPFAHRTKTGLPWVTCKWAQTTDGNIETPDGDSPWISCEESQQLVHEERGCVDAIVVGVGTVTSDNPSLTVRGATKYRTPLRVVVDPHLRTPIDATVLNDDAPTLFVHKVGTDTSHFTRTNLLAVPEKNGVLLLETLFRHLVEEYDATNVIVEGGATLFRHIFQQQLANELWIFTAPHESNCVPSTNMNTLIETLSTTLLDKQPCGIDAVQRHAVTY
jgi:diaminohydroxyphosphoribosylaminopyrimidine deaminase / 5-amino-6-(5-phosphoribosylamino)uracil reductase